MNSKMEHSDKAKEVISIPVVALGDFLDRSVDFIKIDVDVLEGGVNLTRSPFWLLKLMVQKNK